MARYTEGELSQWADRVSSWRSRGQDAYVFFDNNVRAHAPFDALGLRQRLSALPRSRTG